MRTTLVAFAALTLTAVAATSRIEDGWQLESQALRVRIKEESGWMSVLDKRTGTLWRQEDPVARAASKECVPIWRAASVPSIDGKDDDWPKSPKIWLPWTGENGEKNCSGGVRLMWDDSRIYLYTQIRDDNVAFGNESSEKWWEADSVEFWIGSVQVGLHLAPAGGEIACNSSGKAYEGAKTAVRRITRGSLPGYAVELSMPLEHFPILKQPQAGVRFRFAVGVNDADPDPGAPVRRVAQGYYPKTWVHSLPQTFAVGLLCGTDGKAPAYTQENDRSNVGGNGRILEMQPGPTPDTLTYKTEYTRGQTQPLRLSIQLSLTQGGEALDFSLTPDDPAAPMRKLLYPEPLYPEQNPAGYFLCIADYCNGRYLPVTDKMYRRKWLRLSDLPWVAVTDGTQGLMLLALTPWDAQAQTQPRRNDAQQCGFPGLSWRPIKGTAGTIRRGRLHFFAQGGHVKACKLYREVATKDGYVRTLKQKAEDNPNVDKLTGSVNWWGPRNGLTFVQEAKALGVRKGLLSKHTGINGRDSREDIEAIKSLGWLNSEYDCYEDMNDSPDIASHSGPLEKHGVLKADGEYMTAWVSRDKDMKAIHTFMKRCTAMMEPTAKVVIPRLLADYPHNAHFIDVTTATSLKECYHPDHPLTRSEDLICRRRLLSYVANDLKLVTGGEHGYFWNADLLDYHEGQMGGGMYGWPAGYLRTPKSRDEIAENYHRYGINPALRAPLYELVFHDCVVDYCYWGATTDYLHTIAPEITDRKVALNVLYGTPPIMWTHRNGLKWDNPEEREQMLSIYRSTCMFHELIGTKELVAHEFLTADRMVQRTRFADGTRSTVNFTTEPYPVTDRKGRTLTLRENDFYVVGNQIEQWRLTPAGGGKPDIFVHTDNALFSDTSATPAPPVPGVASQGKVWLGTDGPNQALIVLYPGASLTLQPAVWQKNWKNKVMMTLLLDTLGKPIAQGPVPRNGRLTLPVAQKISRYQLLVGPEAEKPDVHLADVEILADGKKLADGEVPAPNAEMLVRASVENNGLAKPENLVLAFRLGGLVEPLCELRITDLAPGERRVVSAKPFPARRTDGLRRVRVEILSPETCCRMGRSRIQKTFRGPLLRDAFPFRKALQLTIPEGDAAGLPVERPFSLEPTVDPGNLRVAFPGDLTAVAQFEPEETGAMKGTLVFQLPAKLAPGTIAAEVLGAGPGTDGVLPLASDFSIAPNGARITLGTYTATLRNGQLKDLGLLTKTGEAKRIVDKIQVSSRETGWSKEPGHNEKFELVRSGPVRAVFHLRRKLNSGHLLERKFRFYADRFEILSRCEPKVDMLTRTYFTLPGKATKQDGKTVVMDGKGQAEDFSGGPPLSWYAVYSPEYRFACIAPTTPGKFIWWDGGGLGQCDIAYQGGGDWEKRLFIFSPNGTGTAKFAEQVASAARNLR